MKNVIYLFSALLPFLFVSCSNEYDNHSALHFKTSLPEEQAKTTLRSSDSGQDALFTGTIEPPKETIMEFCTGKDLEWYNETTGELKFKDHVTKNTRILNFLVYLDEEFLWGLSLIPSVMSYVINVPVLTQDFDGCYYIGRGYPNWEYWTEKCWTDSNWDKSSSSHWVELREKNWKTLVESEGWKLFVQQLKKEGRYRK